MKRTMMNRIISLAAVLLLCVAVSAAEGSDPMPVTVDLDLSVMSGTIVYAQIYNMMVEPESYLGKVIRIAGFYNAYEDTEQGVVYHACVVPDATACCAQGIAFVWGGEHSWPEDYPEPGTEILVTGRLEIYEEDGNRYLHLVDSQIAWSDA